ISRPMTSPTRSSSSTSHVAPRAMLTGNVVAPLRITPRGPSVKRIPGTPRRVGGGPGVPAVAAAHHVVEPAPERRAAGHQRDLLFEAELRKDFCCLRPIIRHISPKCAERRVDLLR